MVESCLRTGLVVLHRVCVHASTSSTVQKKEHTVSSVSTLRFKPSLRLARIISNINSPEEMVNFSSYLDTPKNVLLNNMNPRVSVVD